MALCVCNDRTYYDKLFEDVAVREESSHSEPPTGFGRVSDVVLAEGLSELEFRSGVFSGYILGLGLGAHMSSIYDGFIRSVWDWNDVPIGRGRDGQRFFRAASDHFLREGLNYVDRWVMYNQLFGSLPVGREQTL